MNELQNFNFNNLPVRTVLIDDEPWFVGKDVAIAIGYKNFRDALKSHVKDKYKRESRITTPLITTTKFSFLPLVAESYTDKSSGQGRQIKIINERY